MSEKKRVCDCECVMDILDESNAKLSACLTKNTMLRILKM